MSKTVKTKVKFRWKVPDDATDKEILDDINGQIFSDCNVYFQPMVNETAEMINIKVTTVIGE